MAPEIQNHVMNSASARLQPIGARRHSPQRAPSYAEEIPLKPHSSASLRDLCGEMPSTSVKSVPSVVVRHSCSKPARPGGVQSSKPCPPWRGSAQAEVRQAELQWPVVGGKAAARSGPDCCILHDSASVGPPHAGRVLTWADRFGIERTEGRGSWGSGQRLGMSGQHRRARSRKTEMNASRTGPDTFHCAIARTCPRDRRGIHKMDKLWQ
jgi:hypothetical protein